MERNLPEDTSIVNVIINCASLKSVSIIFAILLDCYCYLWHRYSFQCFQHGSQRISMVTKSKSFMLDLSFIKSTQKVIKNWQGLSLFNTISAVNENGWKERSTVKEKEYKKKKSNSILPFGSSLKRGEIKTDYGSQVSTLSCCRAFLPLSEVKMEAKLVFWEKWLKLDKKKFSNFFIMSYFYLKYLYNFINMLFSFVFLFFTQLKKRKKS